MIDRWKFFSQAALGELTLGLAAWSFGSPERILAKLKKIGHAYNFQERDMAAFLADVRKNGLGTTLADRARGGRCACRRVSLQT